MELVDISGTIGELDRGEIGVLESTQPVQLCGVLVETLTAEPPIPLLDGAVIDDVVVGHDPATITAPGLFVAHSFPSLHIEISRSQREQRSAIPWRIVPTNDAVATCRLAARQSNISIEFCNPEGLAGSIMAGKEDTCHEEEVCQTPWPKKAKDRSAFTGS